MKLDRNINPDGRGKYALIQMRELTDEYVRDLRISAGNGGISIRIPGSAVRLGNESPGDMFFVLKYKDKYAASALNAYARAVMEDAIMLASGDPVRDELIEYAVEIAHEATRAQQTGNQIPT